MKPSPILVDRRGRAACRFGFSLIEVLVVTTVTMVTPWRHWPSIDGR